MRRALLAVMVMLCVVGAARLQPAEAQASLQYPAGWNLVAGPEGATLSGALGALYTLQPGDANYEILPVDAPLHACWGYWAYFPDGGAQSGGSPSGGCTVQLQANQPAMVGNPARSGAAGVVGADALVTYDAIGGNYQTGLPIPAGQGAFATGQKQLSISVPGVTSSAPVVTTSMAVVPVASGVIAGAAISPGNRTPMGAFNLSASLSTATCSGGNVTISVSASDVNHTPVAGVGLVLTITYQGMSQRYVLPSTDAKGTSKFVVAVRPPGGGTTVTWTVVGITSSNAMATTSTTCLAP